MKKLILLPVGLIILSLLVSSGTAFGQQGFPPDAPQPQAQNHSTQQPAAKEQELKRTPSKNHIFWVIPNYREDESSETISTLTPRAKLKVAFDDSFDPSAFLVAGIFAGSAMAQDQYAGFGQGAAGFGKYYGGAFADQAIGNFDGSPVSHRFQTRSAVFHKVARRFLEPSGLFREP